MGYLEKRPVFTGLDDVSFKPVCLASITREIKKGSIIFKEGDFAEQCYIIKEGTVKLVKLTENGEEAIVHIVNAGEILGESALFRTISLHPVTAVAMDDVRVCCLSRTILEQLVKRNPDLAWELLVNLSNQLYKTWEKILELNTQTTREKILGLFEQLAAEYGEKTSKGTLIKMKLTQQEIASLIGASRVMVSKILQELIKEGILTIEKKNYIYSGEKVETC